MILKGNQRAGGGQLARHLLNDRDNDHVTVHELRGFMSNDLNGAFTETYAVSQGTKCKQFLFSLSLNPPQYERVPVKVFEAAIEKIEKRLGLSNQPRALVFHEKQGRRHAHCVWSRIDTAEMKAINLPHYKVKLRDISRELFLENDWRMPQGLQNAQERDPQNYSPAECQQAKRTQMDAATIKKVFKTCWAVSDSAASFSNALEERGYCLAKGDKRGHVVVNSEGEIFAISRWLDLKAKDVRSKLGDADVLPAIDDAKSNLIQRLSKEQQEALDQIEKQYREKLDALNSRRAALVEQQRQERKKLRVMQVNRQIIENKARAAKLPTGLKALWFRVAGQYSKIVEQNSIDKARCDARDMMEFQMQIERQTIQRRALQHEIMELRYQEQISCEKLLRDDRKDQGISDFQGVQPKHIRLIPRSWVKKKEI